MQNRWFSDGEMTIILTCRGKAPTCIKESLSRFLIFEVNLGLCLLEYNIIVEIPFDY